ncbi:hypothetical protein COOONC_08416 [Cooperia oncophora]
MIVKSAIKERWKGNNVRVSVFGSLRTRLFLPTSDIDVLVECDEWKDSSVMRQKFLTPEIAEKFY